MELQARNLFIDTQYFISKSLDFENKDLLALRQLVFSGLINVFITDITEMEIIKKIKEEVSMSYKKLNHSDTRYLKSIPLFRQFLKTYSEEKTLSFFTEKFYDFLKECKVEVIKSESIKFIDILSMHYNSMIPFASDNIKNRKDEFSDAVALMTIKNWCHEKKQKAYILSGDSDWIIFARQTYRFPFGSEELQLYALNDLPELLDTLIRNEKALYDLTAYADSIIMSRVDQIMKTLLESADKINFLPPSFDYNVKIIEHGIKSLKIINKEITRVSRDGASYVFNIQGNGIFKCLVENYDESSYNSEDRKQNYIYEDLVYIIKDFEVDCQIDLGFEEGIPGNFEILSVIFPYVVEIKYKEGEVILINDWLIKQPVIVCGVKDNQITSDGFGSQKFVNLNEARNFFPSLDIWKSSKDFTKALGNKLKDELRFETWAANKLYSD